MKKEQKIELFDYHDLYIETVNIIRSHQLKHGENEPMDRNLWQAELMAKYHDKKEKFNKLVEKFESDLKALNLSYYSEPEISHSNIDHYLLDEENGVYEKLSSIRKNEIIGTDFSRNGDFIAKHIFHLMHLYWDYCEENGINRFDEMKKHPLNEGMEELDESQKFKMWHGCSYLEIQEKLKNGYKEGELTKVQMDYLEYLKSSGLSEEEIIKKILDNKTE
jgi:hypothetical protein